MKKIIIAISILSTACLLASCGKKNTAAITKTNVIVAKGLDNAAQSVSASLAQLAAIDKATHPVAKKPFVTLDGPNLDRWVTITWNGPIAPFLNKVATGIGYHLQVYGKKPLIPILVNVDTVYHRQTAKQVISNADLQSGTRASVLIFPKQRIVSLRYVNS